MKLTVLELAHVRAQDLYITEKCDSFGKLLNQAACYTIAGKPKAYCSAVRRALVFFGDRREARKHSNPGKCVYCGATLEAKMRGARYCDEVRKKRVARTGKVQSIGNAKITGTPTRSYQQIAYAKNLGQGDRIAGPAHPSKIALGDSNPPAGEPST